MNNKQHPAGRKPFLIVSCLVAAAALAIFLGVAAFIYGATQEGHDVFCTSCHSQPETTYYQREVAADAVDMASYHSAGHARCIDCHSGPGVSGRIQAELLGARNAVKWYSGTAVQPAVLDNPIPDQNCLKCHQDVTGKGFSPKEAMKAPERGGEDDDEAPRNHWHVNLARWQKTSTKAGTCLSCHPAHATGGDPNNGFMNSKTVRSTCSACHKVLRHGDD
jgi:hypothetical protein